MALPSGDPGGCYAELRGAVRFRLHVCSFVHSCIHLEFMEFPLWSKIVRQANRNFTGGE